jgi:phosphoribosylglycinamide formyltransferase-1
MDAPLRLRIAVLGSGRGSNLHALLEAIARGDLRAEVALVLSNNSGAGILAIAREHGLPWAHVSAQTHADPGAALVAALTAVDARLLVLAGYMKLLDPRVLAALPGRVVNVHPGPLPRFGGHGMYGEAVHRAVLAAGVTTSGPTVHLVDERYDEGPVLAHRRVPVEPNDAVATLAARVLTAEHDLLWRVIAARWGGDPAALPASDQP